MRQIIDRVVRPVQRVICISTADQQIGVVRTNRQCFCRILQGRFGLVQPEKVAVLAIAMVDGMGIALALGDPEITGPGAVQDVLAALAELLRP